jgi:hypothetical protein
MINAVWGETPPRHAVNLVQRHISELRRALEPDRAGHTPSGLLAWTDGGYLLTLPAGALDLDVVKVSWPVRGPCRLRAICGGPRRLWVRR